MAGILELLRGTTDPTTPGTGLGDIYFKGASDAAMLLYFRRPDGTVVELAPSSGGLVLPSAGGTGIANNNASTLAITGAFATTVTVTGITGVTLPTAGTLATLAGTEELDNKTLNASVGKGTWTASGTWTLPALTLGGNVSSSGNPSLNIGSGALTAGATSVTTLTATSTATLSDVTAISIPKTGGLIEFKNTGGTVRTGYIQEATGNLAIVGEVAGSTVVTYANNSLITTVSSTGLAVTGALSATGAVSINGATDALSFTEPTANSGRNNITLRAKDSVGTASSVYFGQNIYNTDASLEIFGNAATHIGIAGNPNIANVTGTGLAVTGALSATTTVATGGYTVATLPAGTVGMRAYVTDALLPTYNGALTGGGAVTVPVFYNGAAWVSA